PGLHWRRRTGPGDVGRHPGNLDPRAGGPNGGLGGSCERDRGPAHPHLIAMPALTPADSVSVCRPDDDGNVEPEEPTLAASVVTDVVERVGGQPRLLSCARRRFSLKIECARLL